MKLGIGLTNFSWEGPPSEIAAQIARIATLADEAGLDGISVLDHLVQVPGLNAVPIEAPILEGYTLLAFIAGQTTRVRLITLATAPHNRYPALLVKMVTSLDVLSGGRAMLGVGTGNDPDSTEGGEVALGILCPPVDERYQRLEELLQIATRMWSGDETPYHGLHYRLERPLNSPNSLQRPHPPILVAGSGERRTLRLVAQYADACHIPGVLPFADWRALAERKVGVLRAHCNELGRDYDEIEKVAGTPFLPGDDPREGARKLTEFLHQLAGSGFDGATLVNRGRPWNESDLDALASIVPEVHDIPTRAGAAA